jgi:PPOX class probable F420-dependent enzyme
MSEAARGVVPRMAIDPLLHQFATARNFATFSTLAADGSPRTHVMWVDADDEHLLVNTEVHRAKFKDLERDPRVTVTVINAENPYQFIEARGRVVESVRGQEARDHIDALSRRYMGSDYTGTITSERVIVRILPEKVHKNNL